MQMDNVPRYWPRVGLFPLPFLFFLSSAILRDLKSHCPRSHRPMASSFPPGAVESLSHLFVVEVRILNPPLLASPLDLPYTSPSQRTPPPPLPFPLVISAVLAYKVFSFPVFLSQPTLLHIKEMPFQLLSPDSRCWSLGISLSADVAPRVTEG